MQDPPPNPTSIATLPLPFPKPKSRFVQSYPQPRKPYDSDDSNSSSDEEDDDDLFEEEDEEKKLRKKRKVRWRTIAERVTFFVILACLVTSLTAQPLKKRHLWGLVIWKWVLMAMVVFSSRLVSRWIVVLLAFLINHNFILREKVFCVVFGLRKSAQNCIWLVLVLLAWYVLFNPEMEDLTHTHGLQKQFLRVLIAGTIGSVIWLVKVILMKVLALSFQVHAFFDRMKVSVFHYRILEKLSGNPNETMGRTKSTIGNRRSRRINMEKLRRLTTKNVSAYTLKSLMNHVMHSGVYSISITMDRTIEDFKENELDLTSTVLEQKAKMRGKRIFKNVAKRRAKYIKEDDLLWFHLDEDEIEAILPLFPGGQESRKIRKSDFRNWVVEAYIERRALYYSLHDAKTQVQQLHKTASAVVIVIIIIMSLMVMGVATSKILVVVSSQLVLLGFMFGNTCKTVFESIIFIFALHPFDVGDRCVIDGVQVIVEKMNFLMTEFTRYDNEKIYYPNSVLLTKAISNFHRSPQMCDSVEFAIDAATKADTFLAMKDEIKKYIEGRPKYWQPKHHVVVKEIENVNRMRIVLYFTHTINYQNYIEKLNRRSELVLELKKIFETLRIKYNLLPQQVHLVNGDRVPLATTIDIDALLALKRD